MRSTSSEGQNKRLKLKRKLAFDDEMEIEAARYLVNLRRGPRLVITTEVPRDQISRIEQTPSSDNNIKSEKT